MEPKACPDLRSPWLSVAGFMTQGAGGPALITPLDSQDSPMRPIPHERGTSELPEGEQVQQFIRALHQAMVSSHLSQRGLSERIGVKIGTLTKYLRGAVAPLRSGSASRPAWRKSWV